MSDIAARSATLSQTCSWRDRLRLSIKKWMFPGTNWVSRDKAGIVRHFLTGSPEAPIETLDCGCGNAYFSIEAVRRGSRCTGITIHEWEKRRCEEMRDFLGIPADRLTFQTSRLAELAADPAHRGRYDQVLLLDVIEHILDAGAALGQIRDVLADDGFVFITTPNRDWQGNAWQGRVTRHEDGWHVRNGYTFEQLESLLVANGFEPIDRLRYGRLGSTVVTWLQGRLFGRRVDSLTVLAFPLLTLITWVLAPWGGPHTIAVVARKGRADRG